MNSVEFASIEIRGVENLARTLGVSYETIYRWMQQGLPVKSSEGKRGSKTFDGPKVAQWIVDHNKKLPCTVNLGVLTGITEPSQKLVGIR